MLAFPFYCMLMTMFKTNRDLSNVAALAVRLQRPEGNFHWDFWNYATTEHVRFLFEDTNYPQLAAEHAARRRRRRRRSRSCSRCPPATRSRGSPGGWGQSAGVAIFLVYLVPPTLLFLPLSRIITKLGLKDSLWALILVYPSFTIPFATWLLMGFFKTIPQELEDAALVDGCSRLEGAAAGSSSRSRCRGSSPSSSSRSRSA